MNDAKRQRIEDAYIAAHANSVTLLRELQQMVENLPAPNGETPIHWGHVGDLGHVNALLQQASNFLRGEN